MLPVKRQGEGLPALIFMPFTGGSWREYSRTIPSLDDKCECIGLDLPGYGAARDVAGYTVQELAANVADTVASLGLKQFVLVGHSYSGRVAAVVARSAADGDARLKGLSGLILIAPATFSPDPLPEDIRAQLLEMFESPPATDEQGKQKDRQTAEQFILMNVTHTLPADVLAAATEDALLMNRAAWKSWYGDESKKDWSEPIGVLQLPVLIVAGEKDPSLGPSVQEKHNLLHFPNGRLEILNANHLMPLEMPEELAGLIRRFVAKL
jgi:pimeloyl-ACP methyl ester carboxylesterase